MFCNSVKQRYVKLREYYEISAVLLNAYHSKKKKKKGHTLF